MMTHFVFVVLLGLNFISIPCEGTITIVNDENTRYALPGENVIIQWKFDQDSGDLLSRTWRFITTKEDVIASISFDLGVTKLPNILPTFDVTKPATLVLMNVDDSYNGTYHFQLTPKSGRQENSYVTFSIAVRPEVTINCSSSITVNESDTVRCLCKGEGGNPPAKVIWYKDEKPIGVAGDEEKMLTLNDVQEKDSGTYKCVAQSYTLKANKSISISVRYPPKLTSLTFDPDEVDIKDIDRTLTIECEASGNPEPTYSIKLNDTRIKEDKMHKLKLNISHLWSNFTCTAKNGLGSDSLSKRIPLKVGGKPKPDESGDAFPVGGIVGIVIGVLILLVVLLVLGWWCKNKEKDGHRGNAIVNSGNSDPANMYESVNDGGKAGGDKAEGSTSGNPPANANQPAVYATVDKNRKNEPSVTYATLDTMAMQPNGSKRETEPPRAQTEYASIQFEGLKGDLV